MENYIKLIGYLENIKLKKEIIEVMNSELMKKMGLIMSKEMESRITLCALLVLWVQVCK